jgi:hypothetical protein
VETLPNLFHVVSLPFRIFKLTAINTKSLFLSEGEFLFEDTKMEDWGVGLILLFISLFMLCGCLVGLVKILNSMMKGTVQMLDPNVNQRNSST